MPHFYIYGVHAFLELCHPPHSADFTSTVVTESVPTVKWSPLRGMTHPISTTTVVSPAKLLPQPPVPFRIVIDFSPDIRSPCHLPFTGSNHLKGDVRIEIIIDGIARGWKVLPQAKIWPKGARMEFSGSRVGRTEERAFVFAPLPINTRKNNRSAYTHSLPSPPALAPDIPHPLTLPNEDPTLTPQTPSDLPANNSHIQILITLGKKHDTLEKYLIFSPILQEAFYIPPGLTSSPYEELEGDISSITKGIKRKSGTSSRIKKKEAKIDMIQESSHIPPTVVKTEKLTEVGRNVNVYMSEPAEWKPVGLARTIQKTTQMREVEFTARIHLARFWFFVVPDPAYMSSRPRESSLLVSSLDCQQDTKQNDTLVKNNTGALEAANNHAEARNQIKSEGSNIDEWNSQKQMFKNIWESGIGGFSPDNSQVKVEGSEGQFFKISYRDRHPKAVDWTSTASSASGTTRKLSHSTESVYDIIGSANPESTEWTTKSLIAQENTKGIHENASENPRMPTDGEIQTKALLGVFSEVGHCGSWVPRLERGPF